MINKREEEIERENTLWRISIKNMFQSKDLEGLKELRDGPEDLEDEIIEFLNECIQKLSNEKSKEIEEESI